MEWTTSISDVRDNKEILRGHNLDDLIGKLNFTQAIFLTLTGNLPTEPQEKMVNALLVASIDHGIGTPSAMNARVAASTGVAMNDAVAAGMLAMGKKHGTGPLADAAKFFAQNLEQNTDELVKTLKEQKIRIPGYGHAILVDDPRANKLIALAKEYGVAGKHVEFAEKIFMSLNAVSSKKLPLNVDGAAAAIILDLGLDAELAPGFFLISRTPGLVAHVHEETIQETKMRRLAQDEYSYKKIV